MRRRSANIHRSATTPTNRRGLAPLELVLSLPILLCVMALMVIVGSASAWKARTLTVSRQAIWRSLPPRTGGSDPWPRGWPSSAELNRQDMSSSPFEADPWTEQYVVRGPILVEPVSGQWLPVDGDFLDLLPGLERGVGDVVRPFPMLAKMPPGRIDYRVLHTLFDRTRWQFWSMGLPANRYRRSRLLYPFDLEVRAPDFTRNYANAAMALVRNPHRDALRTLHNDDELPHHRPGGLLYAPPYGIGHQPDYYMPRSGALRRRLTNPQIVCSDDPEVIWNAVVGEVVQDVGGVAQPRSLAEAGLPGRLTQDFLNMYTGHIRHIDRLQQMLENDQTPPDVRQAIRQALPEMRANRRAIEPMIQQLQQFAGQIVR